MAFFRNVAAKNKSSVTNVHFCEGEKFPTDFGVWEECSEDDLMESPYNTQLYLQNGIRFYGKL